MMWSSLNGMLLMLFFVAVAARADQVPLGDLKPGVVVRAYAIDQDLRALPELAPGQKPNLARVVPTIDLGDGGESLGELEQNFYLEATGFIEITAAARYKFRLISDDGARLWIGDQLVIDHDGLHGPEPKDGEIELAPGRYALRIAFFQASGGWKLALQWRSLIAAAVDAFETVPAARLAHPKDVPLDTAPGAKRIIPSLRRGLPGDGSPVAGVHPGFKAAPVDAEALAAAGGLDARPDDRVLVLGTLAMRESPADDGPFAWLPLSSEGTTGTTPSSIPSGEFAEQLLVAENPGGGLYRVFVDEVNGRPQGCIFRFSTGLPRVIGAVSWDAAGNLYVGGQGGADDKAAGMLRLSPTGAATFEMKAVRAMSNGLEIEFTQPLDPRVGWEAESYLVERWPDAQSKGWRGPVRDGSSLPVKSASVSEDRRRVFLEVDGLGQGVIYVRLLPPCISESGQRPWSTEAWYTLHRLPGDRKGAARNAPPAPAMNVLSDQEKKGGWKLLFDGKSTTGWRGFGKERAPDGWQAVNGCLVRVGPGGDIITEREFQDFELSLEWRISAAGNSGIFFHVAEDPELKYVWQTGPEMQVLDNAEHPDGRSPLTSAGSNYALMAPPRDVTQPVGLFNQARIVVKGPHVEHWLNGEKLLEYELWSPQWEQLVAGSKFASMPRYGREKKGHIALQDHGDKVWFRNIKIRELP